MISFREWFLEQELHESSVSVQVENGSYKDILAMIDDNYKDLCKNSSSLGKQAIKYLKNQNSLETFIENVFVEDFIISKIQSNGSSAYRVTFDYRIPSEKQKISLLFSQNDSKEQKKASPTKAINALKKAYKDSKRQEFYGVEYYDVKRNGKTLTLEVYNVTKGYGDSKEVENEYRFKHDLWGSYHQDIYRSDSAVYINTDILHFLGMDKLRPTEMGNKVIYFDKYGHDKFGCYGITDLAIDNLIIKVRTYYD